MTDAVMDKTIRLGFLVYDSRSGSTLLSSLLNQYAAVCVSQESNFIANIIEFPGQHIDSDTFDELWGGLWEELQFRELSIEHERLRSRIRSFLPMDKKDLILLIANHYVERRDPSASVLVVKGARQMYHLDALMRMFGDAHMIHIYRDGRAVYASKLRSEDLSGNFMERNIVQAANDWRKKTKSLFRNATVINVKYEELVSNCDQVMCGVLDRLDISEFGRRMTKDTSAYKGVIGDRQKHLHTNVGSTPNSNIAQQWTAELGRFDVLVYETINGPHLESMGYALHESNNDVSLSEAVLIRAYIAFIAFLLLVRKAKKAVLLMGDYSKLKRKIMEKRFERLAMSDKYQKES